MNSWKKKEPTLQKVQGLLEPRRAGWAQRCGEGGTWPRGAGDAKVTHWQVFSCTTAVSMLTQYICGSSPAGPQSTWLLPMAAELVGKKIGALGWTEMGLSPSSVLRHLGPDKYLGLSLR